jgi:hypothetical protein
MKLLLCTALFWLGIQSTTFGQTANRYIHLTYKPGWPRIKEIPFDQVKVFDNRYDTGKFKIEENGVFPPVEDRLDKSTALSIEAYLKEAIASTKRKKGLVYFSIRELEFGNIQELSGNLYIKAEVYANYEGQLRKVLSTSRVYPFNQSYAHTIEKALRTLLAETVEHYQGKHFSDTLSYSVSQINTNVTSDWAAYPIMVQHPAALMGIYWSFEDFRNNHIDTNSFWVEREADSTVRLRYPSSDKLLAKKYVNIARVWALSYHDTLYFPLLDKYLLPLQKENNSFHFYLPEPLPDMYTIICGEMPYVFRAHGPQVTYYSDRAIALAPVVPEQAGINTGPKSFAKPHDQRSKLARNCYLNMDTGDIIYY